MKLDKLVKTLRRDMAANPMKAGVLGVLLLGGLYFWGPLVWKWVVGKKGTAEAPAAAAVPAPGLEPAGEQNAAAQPAGGSGIKETAIGWREMRDQRESDPLARSAEFLPEWNQKFQVAIVAAPSPSPVEVEAAKQKELDPRDLGLKLQGVVIGPKAKKAIVNGRVYREQDLITVSGVADVTKDKGGQQPDLEYRLVRIFRKMVEVERGARTWQVKLESKEPAKVKPESLDQTAQPLEKPLEEQVASPPAKQLKQSKAE